MSGHSLSDEAVKRFKLAAIIFAILLLAEYPIALFIPHGYGFNIFDFAFPSFLAAAGLSAVILFFTFPDKSQKVLLGAFGGLGALLIISGLVNGVHTALIINSLGIVLVPLAWSAISSHETLKESAEKLLFWSLSVLWLVNILHCYFQLIKSGHIGNIGISGNQNWLAAIVFSTSPFAIFVLKCLLEKKLDKKALPLALIVVSVIALPVLYKTQCRTSIVVALSLSFYIPWLFSRKLALIILTVMITGGVSGVFIFKEKVDRIRAKDVREEFWKGTSRLIADNPVTGIGQGRFEVEFPVYKTEKNKKKLFSAHRSGHPHNELLNIALQSGLVGALLWLFIAGKALFSKSISQSGKFTRAGMFILVMHAMADKSMSFNTASLIFYLLLGQVYAECGLMKLVRREKEKRKVFNVVAAVTGVLFLFYIQAEMRSSWLNRKAKAVATEKERFQAYSASWNTAPWRLTPAYMAFSTAVKSLKAYDEAADLYSFLNEKCPNLRFFQLLKGDYLEHFALLNTGDERVALLNEAKNSFELSLKTHGPDLLSHVEYYKFALKYLKFDVQENLYNKIKGIYRYKTDTHFEQWGLNVESWGGKWKSCKKLSEFTKEHEWLLWRLKASYSSSSYFPINYPETYRLLSGPAKISDAVFATDMLILSNKSVLNNDPVSVLEGLIEKIKIIPGDFTMPSTTYKRKSGSRLSQLCLIKSMMRFKGWETILVNDQKDWNAILFNNDQFIYLSGNSVNVITQEDVQNRVSTKGLFYFDYPQSFFYKNLVLSDTLSRGSVMSTFCELPEYVIHSFTNLFPTARIEILKEPFEDLRKRMSGGK